MPTRETEQYSPMVLLGKHSANRYKVHTQDMVWELQTWNRDAPLPNKSPHPSATHPKLDSGLHVFSQFLKKISPKKNGKRSKYYDTWEIEIIFFVSVSLHIYPTGLPSVNDYCKLCVLQTSSSVSRACYFQYSSSSFLNCCFKSCLLQSLMFCSSVTLQSIEVNGS